MSSGPDTRLDRRRLLALGGAGAAAALLSGCDRLSQTPWFRDVIGSANAVSQGSQRTLISSAALAREFGEADISKEFRANGTTQPREPDYLQLQQQNFAGWRLEVGGLVDRPRQYSLDELRALPARTQITRHDCVEGWSSIGKWKGPQLSEVLNQVGVKPEARYVVFRCYDALPPPTADGNSLYYESIDLIDAFHPQTILAYEMNDSPLPVPHGAPLRVRIERQLGYKMAKYIRAIELVDSYAPIAGGKGGYWEDRGYDWYAGI